MFAFCQYFTAVVSASARGWQAAGSLCLWITVIATAIDEVSFSIRGTCHRCQPTMYTFSSSPAAELSSAAARQLGLKGVAI